MTRSLVLWSFVVMALIGFLGCAEEPPPEPPPGPRVLAPRAVIEEVATSEHQWTGVAVSAAGRIFVNFPRWSGDVPLSVAEILADGSLAPYPDEEWNTWDPDKKPEDHFVCVQSVYIDKENTLWILDPANPMFQGIVKGGPKLVKVNLEKNEVEKVILFDERVAPEGSYLNDVRVDPEKNFAFITDSGLGALVVVNLLMDSSWRVLEGDPSTSAEEVVLKVGGREWRMPDGTARKVHSDGIALDDRGVFLYYQALTGRSLYRINTKWLRDPSMIPDLPGYVELFARTGVSDGLLFWPGGSIFVTAIEESAVKRLTRHKVLQTMVSDDRLAWPDSFARGPKNELYVTTSQIHLGPNPQEPYRLFRILVP